MAIQVLMLGFLVEPEYFNERTVVDRYPQVAARKLELGILDGLVSNGARIRVVGSFPSSTFPKNHQLFFGCRRWWYGSVPCLRIPFINLPAVKHATRFVTSFFALLSEVLRYGRPDTVFVYSAHTPYLLAAFLARKICGVDYFVMVPDLPQHMNHGLKQPPLWRMFKTIDTKIITKLVARANGVATITKYVLSDVPEWEALPSVVIEGIAEVQSMPERVECAGKPYFLYSGSLNEAYGVGELVRAFAASKLDAELWICGSGPLSETIRSYSESDSRIKYLGFLSQDRLATVQRAAIGLLITRPSVDPYVRYSFPSKLLEYMGTGVPVLTTRLPGIPGEYYEFLSIIEECSPRGIIDALGAHLSREADEHKQQGRKALKFVKEFKSPKVAVTPLLHLLESRRRRGD